jgi:hypothetical protein
MLRPGQTVAPRSLPPHGALIEAMLPDGYKAEPRPNGKDGHRDCRLKPMHPRRELQRRDPEAGEGGNGLKSFRLLLARKLFELSL